MEGYETTSKKVTDFCIGFFGFYVAIFIFFGVWMTLLSILLAVFEIWAFLWMSSGAILFVIADIAIIVWAFMKKRGYIAIGLIAASLILVLVPIAWSVFLSLAGYDLSWY